MRLARRAGCSKSSPEEGPGHPNPAYRAETVDEAKEVFKKLCERWGNALSSHCGPLGDLDLRSLCVSLTSSANLPVLLRGKAADEGGGSALWGGSALETTALGADRPKRAPGKTSTPRLCGSADGKTPCGPNIIDEALCQYLRGVPLQFKNVDFWERSIRKSDKRKCGIFDYLSFLNFE